MQRKIDCLWKKENPLMSFISRDFEKTIETAPSSIPSDRYCTFSFQLREDWFDDAWSMQSCSWHTLTLETTTDWLTLPHSVRTCTCRSYWLYAAVRVGPTGRLQYCSTQILRFSVEW
jgi:hypothetical protein